jgi:predicted DNA-binding transcriptional regulator AlpA
VAAILRTDATLRDTDRARILTACQNPTGQLANPGPRLLRRREVASRFGTSLRAVDKWSKEGLLPRVRLPGRTRAAGFRESDVAALIAGGKAV